MSYITLYQSNFAQGELSPWLSGRVDIAQYANSAKRIKNMIVRPQGGLMKRPGTIFVAPIKNPASENTKLWDFIYSDSDAYILEVGNQYIRFYRDGGQILSGTTITNGTFDSDISGWSPVVTGTGTVTWDAANARMSINGGAAGTAIATQTLTYLGIGQYTLDFTVFGTNMTYKIGTTSNGTEIATASVAAGAHSINFTPTTAGTIYVTFENNVDSLSQVDDISLTSPIYEINSPWTEDELSACKFAQVYDAMYIVHPNHAPRKLVRVGHAQWTLSTVIFDDGPYYDITDPDYGGKGTGYTLTMSGTSAGSTITVTASSPLFSANDIGRLIRYRTLVTDAWGCVTITGFTSSTVVTGRVEKVLSGTPASTQWRLGAFGASIGYPSTITFHEQRMVLARTEDQQQTIWFSEAGNITGFSPDNAEDKDAVDADSAMTYTIADNKANVIYDLVSQRGIYIISSGGIWLGRPSSQGEALTPENISISAIIQEPAAEVKPSVVSSNSFYVNKFRRKVLEIGYSFQDDAFKSIDTAILAEHRTSGNVAQLAVARSPNYSIWVRKQDGTVSLCTYVKEQNVNAWSEQEFGGTDVSVEQLNTIPGDSEDEIWLLISRTINGETKRYIEYLSPSRLEQDITDAIYLDSAIPYELGVPTSILTGAEHLEGEEVGCLGDGALVVASNVTGGEIELQSPVSNAIVGLPYESIVETSQLASASAASALQGRTSRIHAVALRLYNSFGGQIGFDDQHLDIMPEYNSTTIMGDPLNLFVGDREFIIPSEFNRNPRTLIRHALPVPFNLLSVTYKASVSAR